MGQGEGRGGDMADGVGLGGVGWGWGEGGGRTWPARPNTEYVTTVTANSNEPSHTTGEFLPRLSWRTFLGSTPRFSLQAVMDMPLRTCHVIV